MNWTRFYNFNELLIIEPFAHKEGNSIDWKCRFNGEMLRFQKRDGCLLKQDGKLHNDDCGIYWIRVNKLCRDHPSKVWEYIGLSDNRTGAPYQRGIYGRLADHIRKIQYIPHRSKFAHKMFKKENGFKKSDSQITREKLLINQGASTELRNRYVAEFQDCDFQNCQEFRDFFKKEDIDLIKEDCGEEFAAFFNFNKEHLKEFSDIRNYLESNVQIRFFVIPKMTNQKKYIEIAESICHDAYKKLNQGCLPKLNDRDESQKLSCNDGTNFKIEEENYVKNEIKILDGFKL